ncbi:glycine receptor subunit alpha-4-like [Centruroides vittatus]|uniref:glycine receptor subunit alpha-4-like n=1 Tax=Centruroides vittatus TaxID=120091 RepID=UPI003510CE5B
MMNLHNFPMDVQHCSFAISFMANTDREAILKWMGEEDSPYRNYGRSIHLRNMNLLKFEIVEVTPEKLMERWVSGNFTLLIANFTFIRRLTGNMMNIYIPSTLVVVLSWLSFWIDIDAAPARITLGVTSILTLVTHLVQSRSFVPPADYLKALDVWFIVCILMVFFSLVEYALGYESSKKKMKAKIIKIRPSSAQTDDKLVSKKVVKTWLSYLRDKTQGFMNAKDVNCYDRASRIVFPALFALFSLSYWTYYLSSRQ